MNRQFYKMTSTEANRNFSSAMKNADENGIIEIKRKNTRYLMMTDAAFNGFSGNTITGKCKDGLCRIRFMGDVTEIVRIDPEKGVSGAYSILTVPSKSVTVSVTGSEISVRCHYAEYEVAGGTGEMTYRSGEMDLDLSDKEIEDGFDLDRDEERERLMITLEMRRLFEARNVLAGSLTADPDIVIWG